MGGNITQGLPITLQAAMGGGSAPPTPPTQGDASMEARNAGTLTPISPMAPEGSQRPILPVGAPAPAGAAPDIEGITNVHPVDRLANTFMDYMVSQAQPAKPPAPGSFASKLAGATSALGAGLGDMRTGGDPSKGHGPLGAIGATLNARNERLDKEKQQKFENDQRLNNDRINNARTNAELIQHARNMQYQDEEHRDKDAAVGAAYMDTLRTGYKVEDRIKQSDINARLAKDPNYLVTHAGRITGYEPVVGSDGKPATDVNKRPIESPLWSISDISKGEPATVSAQMAKQWKDAGVVDIQAGQQLPQSKVNQYAFQAQKYGTYLGMLDHDKVLPLSEEVKDQLVDALKNPEIQHAIARNPGNTLAGLFESQGFMADHVKVAQQDLAAAQASNDSAKIKAAQDKLTEQQTLSQELDKTINLGFTDVERAAYVKEKQADAKEDAKEQHEKDVLTETKRHNLVIEGQAAHGGAQGNVPMSDGLVQQIAQLRQVNPTAAKVLDSYDPTTQGSLMAVAFGDGSVDFDKTFPARLTKGAPGINAQTALSVLKQINPNFSPQQYAITRAAYLTATSGKNVQAMQNYNNFMQHSGEAVDALASANRQGPRVWNMALNKLENAGYGTDAAKIQAALSGPREELKLLLSGGYAPQAEESKAIDTILSDAATPGQLSAALQEYAKLGTVRLDNINETYKRVTGKNLPRIIDQATLDSAKHLNLDPLFYGKLQKMDSTGTIFGNQTIAGSNAPNPSAAPTKIVTFGGQRYYTDDQGNNLGPVPKGQ